MKKKLLSYLLYLLGGIVLALILLPFVFEKDIKEAFKTVLNEELNAEVDFEDISLSFIRSFPDALITVDEFSIKGKDQFVGTTLLESEKVYIDFSISSIINKEKPYEIKKLTLNTPTIELLIAEDGTKNYNITKAGESKTNYTLLLDYYELNNTNLSYRDLQSGMSIESFAVNHEGYGEFTQDVYDLVTKTSTTNISLEYGGIKYINQAIVNGDVTLQIDRINDSYTFMDNRIQLNDIFFSLDGMTKLQEEEIYLDLRILAPDANLKNIFSMIPSAYTTNYDEVKVGGSGKISAYLKGSYNSNKKSFPGYGIKLNINEGTIQYPNLPQNIKDLKIDANISNPTGNMDDLIADIPLIRGKIGDDYFDGKLLIKGSGDNRDIDMSIDSDIDLKNWNEAFPISKDLDNMSGEIDADIILKSKWIDIKNKNWSKVIFDANLVAKNVEIDRDSLPLIKVNHLELSAAPKLLEIDGDNIFYGSSDININGTVSEPLGYLTGTTISGNLNIEGGKINTIDFLGPEDKEANSGSIPDIALDLEGEFKRLIHKEYVLDNTRFKGKMTKEELMIENLAGNLNESDFNVEGKLNNLNSYLLKEGILSGNIILSSSLLNVNSLMETKNLEDTSVVAFEIPSDLDVQFSANVGTLKYGKITLANVNSRGSVSGSTISIDQTSSQSFGGLVLAKGMYQTLPKANPVFNFKLDLEKILFREAVEKLETFNYLAPIAKYITGFFNSTLVIQSQLDNKYQPILNTINASGFLETIDGNIEGFGPLMKLGGKLGIDKISTWTVTNTKNWFEVTDGMVELKNHTFDLGDNISLTVGGKHGLGRNLSYNMLLEVPREYLRSNTITGALESGLSSLEKEAAKYGLELNQGEFLLINIGLTGSISDPVYSIKPVGTSSKKIEDMAEGELKKKEEEIRSKINEKVDSTISATTDKITEKTKKIQDSIKIETEKKIKVLKDTIKSQIDTLIGGILDSLGLPSVKDSLNFPPVDILKGKTGKEIEDIKKELEKWNPLKKKKKKTG